MFLKMVGDTNINLFNLNLKKMYYHNYYEY